MTLLSRRNGGNMYIDLPCQACDKASIASARGSGTRALKWGRCMLWTVANLSTTGVPHNLNIKFTTSGWRLHSVMMAWFGRDKWSAITFRQPECVWLLELCPESEATETDPLPAVTRGGNGSHLVC